MTDHFVMSLCKRKRLDNEFDGMNSYSDNPVFYDDLTLPGLSFGAPVLLSAPQTLTNDHTFYMGVNVGTMTITLPAAPKDGQLIYLGNNNGGGLITLACNTGQEFQDNSTTSVVVPARTIVTLLYYPSSTRWMLSRFNLTFLQQSDGNNYASFIVSGANQGPTFSTAKCITFPIDAGPSVCFGTNNNTVKQTGIGCSLNNRLDFWAGAVNSMDMQAQNIRSLVKHTMGNICLGTPLIVNTDTTLPAGSSYVLFNSGSARTITLPTSPSEGDVIYFGTEIASGEVTLTTNSGAFFPNGDTTKLLTATAFCILVYSITLTVPTWHCIRFNDTQRNFPSESLQQVTSVNTNVTNGTNKQLTKITLVGSALAPANTAIFTFNNTLITTSSKVLITTECSNGSAYILGSGNPGAGSIAMIIRNLTESTATPGTIRVNVLVINPSN